MARRKTYVDVTPARFVEGTFARIAAVAAAGEDRAGFIRQAVERELRRRERKAGIAPDGNPRRRYHSKIADRIA